jgi:hypothetical protein
LLAASLIACSSVHSRREACLAELDRFAAGVGGRLFADPFRERLSLLRQRRAAVLRREELAWLLVPGLGLSYRLRRGAGPLHSQRLLEDLGLMRPGSGGEPVSVDELRKLLNRAALPEAELLLSGAGPLPVWLSQP